MEAVLEDEMAQTWTEMTFGIEAEEGGLSQWVVCRGSGLVCLASGSKIVIDDYQVSTFFCADFIWIESAVQFIRKFYSDYSSTMCSMQLDNGI